MPIYANGRAISVSEAERIIANGGSVYVEGTTQNATVEAGSSHCSVHFVTLQDGTQRLGGSPADTLRTAFEHAH